jgi:hypothetical protein
MHHHLTLIDESKATYMEMYTAGSRMKHGSKISPAKI